MSRRLSAIFTGVPLEDKKSAASSRQPSPDTAQSRSPGKLFKHAPAGSNARRPSAQFLAPSHETSLPSLQDLQQDVTINSSTPDLALLPPPSINSGYHSRASSRDRSMPGTPRSRPMTPSIQLPDQSPIIPGSPGGDHADKLRKKHWWTRGKEKDEATRGPAAWIAGHPQKLPYDFDGLMNGRSMQEMWDNNDGNCLVHLFPRNSGKGPSFKVDSAVFASSPVLTKLAFGDIYSNNAVVTGDRKQMPLETRTQQLSVNEPATPPTSPKRNMGTTSSTSSRDSRGRYSNFSDVQETTLYLPIKLSSESAQTPTTPTSPKKNDNAASEDLQTLVDYRNFFAFLSGQSLIATERRSSFFGIFMTIAGILKSFQFTNVDGSTYGEVAASSFDNYVEELGLADVRSSREKTIEGIVLGERMKSVLLYNEAFTHGVGKHEDLLALKSPKFSMISPVTQNRLTRAAMDLEKRVSSIRLTMTEFDFPFLFSGIMSSKTSIERKEGVRFDQWKEHFLGMRKFVMGMYKQRYGDWPPKASSKKNTLETSGLNRLVLRDVYHDLSSLYDLIVDRNHLTTRTIDGINEDGGRDEPVVRGLRAILSEYDRSSPPVKPPVPFDLPKIPSLHTIRNDFGKGDVKKDAKATSKKLKDDEVLQLLRVSWNGDAPATPFVDAFREMEKRAARGCSIKEMEDLRIGQWIFMYVVLQALPMLACDAPGLKWTKAVEYFLCEPPRSGVPWADSNASASAVRRTWFSVGGAGGGVVSLPSDVIEHGVEGIYRRSHCWVMAEKWAASNPILSEALQLQQSGGGAGMDDPLPAPPSGKDLLRPDSRSSDHSRRSKRYSSLAIGLEALPLPQGVTPDGSMPSSAERPRTPKHSVDTSKTFDSILGGVDTGVAKGKKKK
ncbi:Hypothetical predicted protein [Lecanosticta acicola]|uniref:DUF8004 domain-containing protein n=1 Tax=Lecanosticta acicola TaxID=111012 RepID=A0AAI8YS03_9PEZI|nr:Hypothetical predicted protein [Lecanosticta acicola]